MTATEVIDAHAARLRELVGDAIAVRAVLEDLVRALLVEWLERDQMAAVEAVMNPAFEVPSGDYDLSIEADREYIAGRLMGRRAVAAKRGVERLEAILETCGLSGEAPPTDLDAPFEQARAAALEYAKVLRTRA